MNEKITIEPIVTQYLLSKDNCGLSLEVDEAYIAIKGLSGYNFIFKSSRTKQTIKKWKDIISLLSKAVDVAEETLKTKK